MVSIGKQSIILFGGRRHKNANENRDGMKWTCHNFCGGASGLCLNPQVSQANCIHVIKLVLLNGFTKILETFSSYLQTTIASMLLFFPSEKSLRQSLTFDSRVSNLAFVRNSPSAEDDPA